MAKKQKEYWYVLVAGNNGCVFVTDIDWNNKTAEWDKKKKPKELSKGWAQDLSFGLTMNGNPAFAVGNSWEITSQPYRYDIGNFYWRKKKNADT